MKIATFVWQFDEDYPGMSADDRALPIAEVWCKTHAGPHWMASAYVHPAAPAGADSVAHLVQVYGAQGIGFVPWCEPTGRDLPGEIARASEVLEGMTRARAAPRLVFDLEVEPTANFWKGTPADLRALVAGIRDRVPRAELCLCHYQHDEIAFGAIADLFDSFSTMDYWNDFGVDPLARLGWSHGRLAGLGRPVIYGLPGNAPTAEMLRALAWVRDVGGGRAVIWRRGTTTAANWQAIAGCPMETRQAEPKPEQRPEPTIEQVQLGLVRKVLDKEWAGLVQDARKLAGVTQ